LYGKPLDEKNYDIHDFDWVLFVKERQELVAHDITNYLKNEREYDKTILFCQNSEGGSPSSNLSIAASSIMFVPVAGVEVDSSFSLSSPSSSSTLIYLNSGLLQCALLQVLDLYTFKGSLSTLIHPNRELFSNLTK
jgi:hypothetical protein